MGAERRRVGGSGLWRVGFRRDRPSDDGGLETWGDGGAGDGAGQGGGRRQWRDHAGDAAGHHLHRLDRCMGWSRIAAVVVRWSDLLFGVAGRRLDVRSPGVGDAQSRQGKGGDQAEKGQEEAHEGSLRAEDGRRQINRSDQPVRGMPSASGDV